MNTVKLTITVEHSAAEIDKLRRQYRQDGMPYGASDKAFMNWLTNELRAKVRRELAKQGATPAVCNKLATGVKVVAMISLEQEE